MSLLDGLIHWFPFSGDVEDHGSTPFTVFYIYQDIYGVKLYKYITGHGDEIMIGPNPSYTVYTGLMHMGVNPLDPLCSPPGPLPPGSYTFSTWVKYDDTDPTIVEGFKNDRIRIGWVGQGYISFSTNSGSLWTDRYWEYPFVNGTWYHICLTVEYGGVGDATYKCYVNSNIIPITVGNAVGPIWGAHGLGNAFQVHYSLNAPSFGDTRIYNRTLDHPEVVELYMYISTPPIFNTHPSSVLQYEHTNALFTSGVTGGQNAYQWYIDNTTIDGATGLSYTRPDISIDDDLKDIKMRVYYNPSNKYVDSNTATLDVVAAFGMTGPSDVFIKAGNNATYAPTITSGEPVGYQWNINDGGVTGSIAGATGLSYTFPVAGTDNTNRYFVDVRDPITTYRSYAGLLTVGGSMVPTNPSSIYFYRGETGIFTDGVTGGIGPYTYQWQRKDN